MNNQMFKSLNTDGVTEIEFELDLPVTDDEINEMIDVHVDIAREYAEEEMRDKLDRAIYPRFGYTTAQEFQNEEEYEQFLRDVLNEEVEEFRQALFDMVTEQSQQLSTQAILDGVMTSSEIEYTYNLSQSTVAQAIHRGQIPARKSGGTWLIARKDADVKWNKRRKS